MSQTHLALRIVPFAEAEGDSGLGVAFLAENEPGIYSDVFYPSIEKLCRNFEVNISLVLGGVMAHEIGHLLLGTHAHTPTGIMCPRWGAQELDRVGKGTLLFTDAQAQKIRARLMSPSDESHQRISMY